MGGGGGLGAQGGGAMPPQMDLDRLYAAPPPNAPMGGMPHMQAVPGFGAQGGMMGGAPHAQPQNAMQRGGFGMHPNGMTGMGPMGGAQMGGMSMGGMPMGGAPMGGTPMGGMPTGGHTQVGGGGFAPPPGPAMGGFGGGFAGAGPMGSQMGGIGGDPRTALIRAGR